MGDYRENGGGGNIKVKVVKKLGKKKKWTRSNWLGISSNGFRENGTEPVDLINACIFLAR